MEALTGLDKLNASLQKIGGNLTEICDRLAAVENRLDGIETLVSKAAIEDEALSAYPAGYLEAKEAAKLLKLDISTLYDRIAKGHYSLGNEVKNLAPEGAERPTYRLNVRAILRRS